MLQVNISNDQLRIYSNREKGVCGADVLVIWIPDIWILFQPNSINDCSIRVVTVI